MLDAGINFILATKCGCTDTLPGLNASTRAWTRDNLFRGLEISLKRLLCATGSVMTTDGAVLITARRFRTPGGPAAMRAHG